MFFKLQPKEYLVGSTIFLGGSSNSQQIVGDGMVLCSSLEFEDTNRVFLGTLDNPKHFTKLFTAGEVAELPLEDFLEFFDIVPHELTDRDVMVARTKVEEEDTPLGNLLLSLLDISESLLESLQQDDETLYYIKLPHLRDDMSYVNLVDENNRLAINSKEQTTGFKTEFKMSEIEELMPEFKQFAVEVE